MAKGFEDRSGEFPRRDSKNSTGVNSRASGSSPDARSTVGPRGPRVSSKVSQIATDAVSEPSGYANPIYPYNSVKETLSGHVIEYDDTPGSERINIQHRTGSKVEILPDGSILVRSNNNSYDLVAGDKSVTVRGTVTIVVESNLNMRVKGDMNMQVDGDQNLLVQGNQNTEILGNRNTRVHGNDTVQITGSWLQETRGNVIQRNLSNFRGRTVGDHVYEIGADWKVTVEGDVHQRAYGQFQGSFHGGLVTLNGLNADDEIGAGQIVATDVFSVNHYGENEYILTSFNLNGDCYIDGNSNIAGDLYTDGTIHAPAFEGTARRADYATTAGAAPTGTAIPTTPSPTSAEAAGEKLDEPTSIEEVVDVTGTSDPFILSLDRQPITGFNKRILNTYEIVSRARNKSLRNNGAWLQDHIDNGVILSSITSSNAPRPARTSGGAASTLPGITPIGQVPVGYASAQNRTSDQLRVEAIPSNMILTSGIAKSSKISPNFKVSHVLSGDSIVSGLKDQAGLTAVQIAQNTQLLAYNILEPLRNKYKDTWNISEGVYNLLENEKIDSSSITVSMVKGLGVGIQFPVHKNSQYFDVATWIESNLVFDSLVLSYIDYDPSAINEPTLIVTIKPGSNARAVWTEFNHVKVADELQDLG